MIDVLYVRVAIVLIVRQSAFLLIDESWKKQVCAKLKCRLVLLGVGILLFFR
jgi:hypothetical protein